MGVRLQRRRLDKQDDMDAVQQKHERAVGEAFVAWYNGVSRMSYEFHVHGSDPPDLIYRNGSQELLLEITAGYYDAAHATMLWQNAREVPGAPDSWSSKGPDQKLIDHVNLAIEKKSAKAYPSGCLLVIAVYPDLASADEFAALLPELHVPDTHPFGEIYVGGLFPASSGGSAGGYFWWKLWTA